MPFLDHDLVEPAAACPPELRLADGGKGVLKALGRYPNGELTPLRGNRLWRFGLPPVGAPGVRDDAGRRARHGLEQPGVRPQRFVDLLFPETRPR